MKSYDKIIKNHYNKVAKKWGTSFKSTMEDVTVRTLETEFIIQMIRSLLNNHFSNIRAPKLIDVGCGNGYSLSIIKKKFKNLNLYGLEPNNKLSKLAKSRFNKKKLEYLEET